MLVQNRQNRVTNPMLVLLESNSDLQNSPMISNSLHFTIFNRRFKTALTFGGGDFIFLSVMYFVVVICFEKTKYKILFILR